MAESPTATDLIANIQRAFADRNMPAEVVEMEGRYQIDSDVEDGLWFAGRDWRSLTLEDWRQRHCGFLFLSPEAFAYYLPSILILTVQNPKHCPDLAVQSFLSELDRSPGIENLDSHLANRFSSITRVEYEAIKEWLLWASECIPHVFYGTAVGGAGDGFGRAFDTIDLLQRTAGKRGIAEKLMSEE